jgi:hypothetical protein
MGRPPELATIPRGTMIPRILSSLLLLGLCSHGLIASEPSTLQEQAEFLAGIPLGKGSALSPLQKSPEYRRYQKELEDQWAFCRSVRYETMQQWGRDHLGQHPSTRGVLRYLFGGPDFLNAYAFFPDTRVMVLGGLEPVGEVPPPEALDPASLGGALRALEEALHTSLFCGYFITSEMKPQLVRGSFQGVLPVLYTELALTGNVIDSMAMVGPFGSPGVQITYHRQGGASQTLYYFQADLSNGRECRRFLAWLNDLGPGVSYLKAASYLLPLDSFSETRAFLLKTSSLILQDDSGIPFGSFLTGEWRIQLFGIYTDPLPIFKLKRNPSLAKAYASALHVGSLPFGAGYHVNACDANLLLAVSENATPPLGSLPPPVTPPALPAFSSPTPKPRPVRIRKALPVTVKKAIAVPTPASQLPAPTLPPTPLPTPSRMEADSLRNVIPSERSLTPTVAPEEVPMTESKTTGEQPSQAGPTLLPEPLPTPPVDPPMLPTTANGRPVD